MTVEKFCIGIESTAHTYGVGVVSSKGRILSDVKSIYQPKPGRGIHPRESAQHHSKLAPEIAREALRKSGVGVKSLAAVAFSQGPGLGPCLRTGASAARAIASYLGIPLIPVHHAIGHIEVAAMKSGARAPLTVLVSGGHTCITAFMGGRWRIFGETEDITLGNLLDMYGRQAGLSSPSGPAVEQMAQDKGEFIDLPLVVKGNNISYSGLLTSAVNKLKDGVGYFMIRFSIF